MQLETCRFGVVDVEEQDVFEVPNGIPGFPDLRRVTLFRIDPMDSGEASLFWLQDLDNGNLAFLCVVPWGAFPDYDIEIDESALGIEDASDVRLLNLVTVRRDPEDDSRTAMTVNLRAPLVVDVHHRRVQQHILADARWSVFAPLGVPAPKEG